jgi:undecaprenyl-diphosphatase
MSITQIIVLSLIQGFTEFLPISSSAHLILMPHLFGWRDQGLYFDVATNTGTLFAVLLYLRREVIELTGALFGSLTGRGLTPNARLAWAVLFGTIPVGLAGLLVAEYAEQALRSPLVIGASSIFFGLLLWWADARCRGARTEHDVGARDVVVIGVAQALALIPGTSRSGITMTAGVFQGLSREGAARFSFLLAIPVSVLAGGLDLVHLVIHPQALPWGTFAAAMAIAFVSGYACIDLFMRLISRIGFAPFVIYRVLLGAALLIYFL